MPGDVAVQEEEARLAAEHAAAEAQRSEVTTEDEGDDDDKMFDAGFAGEPTPDEDKATPTLIAPETSSDTGNEPPKPEDSSHKQEAAPKPEVSPSPVGSLTKEQVDNILSIVTLVPELKSTMEKQFGTAFGKMGGLERTLKAFQDSTASAGEVVKVSKEDLKDMVEEFPDLSEKLIPVFNRVLEKVKVPKVVAAPATFDEAILNKAVEERLRKDEAARRLEAIEEMSARFPDWRDVVGAPGGKTEGQETPWKAWLKTQPAWYQKKLNNTWDPSVVATSIEKFKTATAPAPKPNEPNEPKGPSRKERLQEAAQVKKPSPSQEVAKSDDEMFDEGFNSNKGV